MNKREIQIAFAVLCLLALFPVVWLSAIDWIQYDERVVGENSPYYDDVVNRPAKQIFQIYTTEHNEDGTHKTTYTVPGDLNAYMLITGYDANADSRADNAETLTDGTNTSTAAQVRAYLDTSHLAIDDGVTNTSTVWSSSKTNTAITTAVSGVSVSEFALRGTGSGSVAYATFTPAGFFTGNDTFSIYGVVSVDQLSRAESFYSHVETEYSTNVINFGKSSDNKLQVTIGATTYTSGVVWTSDTIGTPVEVGVICNKAGGTLWFMFGGEVFASQAATYTFPAINNNEVHSIGNGFDGDIFAWHITKTLLFNASTKHTPIAEGLSQCASCLASYDFDETTGATLTDRYIEQKGAGTAHNLVVAGTWTEYARGY